MFWQKIDHDIHIYQNYTVRFPLYYTSDPCAAAANESGTIEISTLIAMDSGYLCTSTSLNQVPPPTPTYRSVIGIDYRGVQGDSNAYICGMD